MRVVASGARRDVEEVAAVEAEKVAADEWIQGDWQDVEAGEEDNLIDCIYLIMNIDEYLSQLYI